MILGLGIDVCSIARVDALLTRWGDRFERRILGEAERAAIAQRVDRATVLAGRFAAKEAAAKAMAGGVGVGWHDLEVRSKPRRAPELVLHGAASALASRVGVRTTHLSITHDSGVAAAVVVLEGEATGEPWR
ncbi:MAG: holo-[acyl-carrier-protein] synthase [Myxococcales bacterium]|nr:holo-[acyl-carrier-protein] synthase [Myxococcales bacterium]